MDVTYEPEGTRPVCEQFPAGFSNLIERLKGESWAEKLAILDSDFNRHLVFRAQGKAGSVLESSPISIYNLKRLTTSEMIRLVRSSLVAPSEQT